MTDLLSLDQLATLGRLAAAVVRARTAFAALDIDAEDYAAAREAFETAVDRWNTAVEALDGEDDNLDMARVMVSAAPLLAELRQLRERAERASGRRGSAMLPADMRRTSHELADALADVAWRYDWLHAAGYERGRHGAGGGGGSTHEDGTPVAGANDEGYGTEPYRRRVTSASQHVRAAQAAVVGAQRALDKREPALADSIPPRPDWTHDFQRKRNTGRLELITRLSRQLQQLWTDERREQADEARVTAAAAARKGEPPQRHGHAALSAPSARGPSALAKAVEHRGGDRYRLRLLCPEEWAAIVDVPLRDHRSRGHRFSEAFARALRARFGRLDIAVTCTFDAGEPEVSATS